MIYKIYAFNSDFQKKFSRTYKKCLSDDAIFKAVISTKNCNFVCVEDFTIVFKKFERVFISFVITDDNEMFILNLIGLLMSIYDKHFGSLQEAHFTYNFIETHCILDSFIVNGIVVETDPFEISKKIHAQVKNK